MANEVLYRVPGVMSRRSLLYIENLKRAGWKEHQFQQLVNDLPHFESASIRMPYEEALESMVEFPAECHHQFLEKLNVHIRTLTTAERLEELHNKAKGQGKDSIEANRVLAQTEPAAGEGGVGEGTVGASIHFHVKEAKSDVQVTLGKKKADDE